ncbi:MAG TPA: zinc ribbon domain-containing protein [Vicinamibacterales bacterium]|jgi:putative FmdB family regulatory protein|nr:zinc ribbon domain-containing protein [Vicinamibacterales bacterium]
MPLYEYQCDACGRRFELIRKFSDPPLESCPTCGGAVHKLMSTPAFQFKGSGWYITDYAKKTGPSEGDESKADAAGKETPAAEAGEKTEKPKQAEKSDKVEATGKTDASAKAAKSDPSSGAATPQKSS